MAKYAMGWIPSAPDFRDRMYAPKPDVVAAELPPSIDLSDKCGDVFNQGSLGSCGPQTAASDLIHAQLGHEKRPTAEMPSRLFVYYCTRGLMGTINQDSGVSNRELMKALNRYGWCDEVLWPYSDDKQTFRRKPAQECFEQGSQRRISEYLAVPQKLDTMKACLAGGDPFIFGFSVYSSISKAEKGGVVPFPSGSDQMQGGHDVLVCGYDDAKGQFKFKNSWGKNWGDKGYGYISYQYATHPQLASDFWTVNKSYLPAPAEPEPPPQADDLTIGFLHFRAVKIDGHDGIFVYV